VFWPRQAQRNCPRAIATTIDNQWWQHRRCGVNLAISDCLSVVVVAIMWLHFSRVRQSSSWSKMPDFTLEFRRCHSSRDVTISRFGGQLRSLLESSRDATFKLAVVENLRLPLEFWWWHMSYFRRCNYFRFWWPYSYFRLSVVFEITVFEIAMVGSLRFAVEKKQKAMLSQRNRARCRSGLKFADNIRYKCKSSQASKARLQSFIYTGAKQNLTQNGRSRSFKVTCFGVSGKAIRD